MKKMKIKAKKIAAFVLALAMSMSTLSACNMFAFSGEKQQAKIVKDCDAYMLMAYIEAKYEMPYEESEQYDTSCEDYYFYDDIKDIVLEFAAIKSEPTNANEYIIAKTSDVEKLKTALEEYRLTRLGDFTGYAPKEESKLQNAQVVTNGEYVALFVCDNSEEVSSAFSKADTKALELDGNAQFLLENFVSITNDGNTGDNITEEGNTEEGNNQDTENAQSEDGLNHFEEIKGQIDVYDTSHIVEAYKAGDVSMLSDEKDIQVYNECCRIIEEVITDDMSVYDKEKAIHNYISQNTSYDDYGLEHTGWYTEYSDQPYGCLVRKQAICVGYATTFKLFMDILDIECIVVTGSATEARENHGWNLVKLDDGCWYAVDVTWDDPVGGEGIQWYDYFNVDDSLLINSSHNWTKADYPTATGGKYSGLEETDFDTWQNLQEN